MSPCCVGLPEIYFATHSRQQIHVLCQRDVQSKITLPWWIFRCSYWMCFRSYTRNCLSTAKLSQAITITMSFWAAAAIRRSLNSEENTVLNSLTKFRDSNRTNKQANKHVVWADWIHELLHCFLQIHYSWRKMLLSYTVGLRLME